MGSQRGTVLLTQRGPSALSTHEGFDKHEHRELLINELGDNTQTVCAELALSLNIVTFPCQNCHHLRWLCFSFPFLLSPPPQLSTMPSGRSEGAL